MFAILKYLTGFFASIFLWEFISPSDENVDKNKKNDNRFQLIIILVLVILFLIFSSLDNSTHNSTNVFMPAPE